MESFSVSWQLKVVAKVTKELNGITFNIRSLANDKGMWELSWEDSSGAKKLNQLPGVKNW